MMSPAASSLALSSSVDLEIATIDTWRLPNSRCQVTVLSMTIDGSIATGWQMPFSMLRLHQSAK